MIRRLLPALLLAAPLAGSLLLAPTPAEARPPAVGLGIGAGIAIPDHNDLSFKPAFSWGFYTDIPLLSSFHITPSTLVYKLSQDKEGVEGFSATDVSLNFKFVVPVALLDIFGGITAGVTSTSRLDPHVGVLAGASLNVVSNLDLFVNVSYRLILADGGNVRDLQAFAGPLIRFMY